MNTQKIEVEVPVFDGFKYTGEYREPKEGEWCISGLENDMIVHQADKCNFVPRFILEKIKKLTRSECIKLMKENESTKFEDWPEEVRKCAEEIGKSGFEYKDIATSGWKTKSKNIIFKEKIKYRLRSDWQDEDDKFNGFDGLEFCEISYCNNDACFDYMGEVGWSLTSAAKI